MYVQNTHVHDTIVVIVRYLYYSPAVLVNGRFAIYKNEDLTEKNEHLSTKKKNCYYNIHSE